jgi:type IV secretory pathway TrbD component
VSTILIIAIIAAALFGAAVAVIALALCRAAARDDAMLARSRARRDSGRGEEG